MATAEKKVNKIEDWEEKLERIVDETINTDIFDVGTTVNSDHRVFCIC